MTISSANTEQHAYWNGVHGQRWADDPVGRDRIIAPVADVVLAAADLRAGDDVIDIGCGCGATSLDAARAVTGTGSVLGIDLSRPMLAIARDRAVRARLTNTTFVPSDAQTHDLAEASFDAAISRFGTMFFDDPAAAFTNVARSLRAGGRLAIATWQPLVANDWLLIPGVALLDYGSLPETAPGPGMFAQSEPDTITSVLAASGFDEIAVDPVTVTLVLGADPDAATAHLADTSVGRTVLETIPEHVRPTALDAVRAVLAQHAGPAGVSLGAAIWMTTARRAG